MAKILLACPPLTKDEMFKRGAKGVGSILPPLGIAYIASTLEKYGHKVNMIDGIAEGTTIKDLTSRLNGFDIVGLTANTNFAFRVKETAKAIKEKDKDLMIIVGGSHAHTIPMDLLGTKNIDFTATGEAEYTFIELADQFDKGKKTKDIQEEKKIKGLAFLDSEGKLFKTESRPLIKNLDDIPMPARHLLPMHLYKTSEARASRQPSHSIITARGCPYTCTFCYQDLYGKSLRGHSPKRVVDEMELLINKYGAKEISFWDDVFTIRKDRVIEICKLIKERKLDIPWSCESRADSVNKELLKEMAEAKCEFISYGIESGSERMLKVINKMETKDKIREGFKLTKEAGIKTRGYLMLGLYDETLEEMQQTIDFAIELDPDTAGFTIWCPFPGTTDYRRVVEDGSYSGEPYWENRNIPDLNFLENAIYTPNNVTNEQIMKMHKKAIRSFYLRPGYIWRQLKGVRNFEDMKRLYLGAKAVFSS